MNSVAIDLHIGHGGAAAPALDHATSSPVHWLSPEPLSAQLLAYWRCQLPRPTALRRGALEIALERVRIGAASPASLVQFALGDSDEHIVFRATAACLTALQAGRRGRHTALEDAIEWVRRRLALNRPAVFAALLSRDDERVLERLLPLRLTLDDAEFDAVRRHLAPDAPEPTRQFLREWIALRGSTGQRSSMTCQTASVDAD